MKIKNKLMMLKMSVTMRRINAILLKDTDKRDWRPFQRCYHRFKVLGITTAEGIKSDNKNDDN